MTALLAVFLLTLQPLGSPRAEPAAFSQAAADTADTWRVYVDGEEVLQARASAPDSMGQAASLPFSTLNGHATLTVHYVTEDRYPRARTIEFRDEDGLVMFGYEEMEESEDNPMQIPLEALALALGGAPEGPLTVIYWETSGGRITRGDTVLFVVTPGSRPQGAGRVRPTR